MTPKEMKQLDRLEEKVDRLVAAMFGDVEMPDRPGFVERLRAMETYVSTQKRILWLAAGSAVTSLVVMAFDVLTR